MTEKFIDRKNVFDLSERIKDKRNEDRNTGIGTYLDGRVNFPERKLSINVSEAVMAAQEIINEKQLDEDLLEAENTYRRQRRTRGDYTDDVNEISSLKELEVSFENKTASYNDAEIKTDNLLMVLDNYLKNPQDYSPLQVYVVSIEILRRISNSGN